MRPHTEERGEIREMPSKKQSLSDLLKIDLNIGKPKHIKLELPVRKQKLTQQQTMVETLSIINKELRQFEAKSKERERALLESFQARKKSIREEEKRRELKLEEFNAMREQRLRETY